MHAYTAKDIDYEQQDWLSLSVTIYAGRHPIHANRDAQGLRYHPGGMRRQELPRLSKQRIQCLSLSYLQEIPFQALIISLLSSPHIPTSA